MSAWKKMHSKHLVAKANPEFLTQRVFSASLTGIRVKKKVAKWEIPLKVPQAKRLMWEFEKSNEEMDRWISKAFAQMKKDPSDPNVLYYSMRYYKASARKHEAVWKWLKIKIEELYSRLANEKKSAQTENIIKLIKDMELEEGAEKRDYEASYEKAELLEEELEKAQQRKTNNI